MDEKVFDKLKKTKYDDKIELSKLASWAVWDDKDIENPEIIKDNIENLKSNIVFVALNFGGKKKTDNWKDWQNFHGKGVGDQKLCKILSKPEFKGAYMTDLIKDLHNPKAKQAAKTFENNETKRNKDIEFLFQEIDMLETNNIKMYLFGEDVETLFKKYVIEHKGFKTFKQKVIKCQRIYHFAHRFINFEKTAPIQLDLVKPKNQKEQKWIFYPLWDCSERQCPRCC
jgi:hypothetical protein